MENAMRFWLLYALLATTVVVEAHGQEAAPARPKSYPITLKADEVREFAPLNIDYAGLRLSSPSASVLPIVIQPGVTGLMVIGNGTFRFVTPAGEPVEGNFRAAMLRFNPRNHTEVLPFETVPSTTDRATHEISNQLLKQSFRRCWHSGPDALIPDEGSLAAVVYSREHGELLISISKNSTVVYSFSDKRKLYEHVAP
jgi:hypothetical protein